MGCNVSKVELLPEDTLAELQAKDKADVQDFVAAHVYAKHKAFKDAEMGIFLAASPGYNPPATTPGKMGYKPHPFVKKVPEWTVPEPPDGGLPDKWDTRLAGCGGDLPPVQNQGQLGACTTFSIGDAYTYNAMKEGLPMKIPSHLFIYWNERYAEGTVSTDSGGSIQDSVLAINKYGAPPEELWPYDISKFRQCPPLKAYEAGKYDRATKYFRLDKKDTMAALAAGHLVNIGMVVYPSINTVGADGVLPMPRLNETPEGGHAVCVVGYEKDKHVIIMNSWGTDWGDKGFFYMPWDYYFSDNVDDPVFILTLVTESVSL